MTLWTPIAFVRYTLFFITGILLGVHFQDSWLVYIAETAFISLVALFVILTWLFPNARLLAGSCALLALFFAGYFNVSLKTESRNTDHFMHVLDSVECYQAVISTYLEERNSSWKTTAEVVAIRVDGNWRSSSGKVMLYFSKTDFPEALNYGDVLLVRKRPQAVQPPGNPHEFDYRRFLSFRNIFHQHFLRRDYAMIIRNDPPSWIMDISVKLRSHANNTLKKYVTSPQEQGIVSALVLGVTDGLDDEITHAYSATGTMHVLAVSGLHVGIIYWIILFLLRPLKNSLSGRWMLALISITVLWLYAFVTGLSPSVLRAVSMFSMVALAGPWGKRTNIYNTLFISAFCLLMYDPYLLMSVGFQLSYLAVFGIVFFYPLIYNWWQPNHWLADKVWQTTSVSIAAQLATFPVSLLYFHQFPVYFLLSNLVAIPVAFVVLVGGLLLLMVSFFSPAASLLGACLTWAVKLLNLSVTVTESLPMSLIENVQITTSQCWLLMAMIVAFALVFIKRRFYYLTATALLAMCFAILEWYPFKGESAHDGFVIYKVPGHYGIDFIQDGHAWFVADSSLLENPDRIDFHISPNRIMRRVKHLHTSQTQPFIKEFDKNRLILWNDLKLLILCKDFNFTTGYTADYLIISSDAVRDVSKVVNRIGFSYLIIDSSNSYYNAERLLKQAHDMKLPVHSILHHGAFEVDS